MNDNYKKLGLSDLLDQDLSSYEYFYSLSPEIRHRLEKEDIADFNELQLNAQKIQNIYNMEDNYE